MLVVYLVIKNQRLVGTVQADTLTVARAKAYAKYGPGCLVEPESTQEDLEREQYHGR
jgi:hypothetical protein